jgi:hypothetical protein
MCAFDTRCDMLLGADQGGHLSLHKGLRQHANALPQHFTILFFEELANKRWEIQSGLGPPDRRWLPRALDFAALGTKHYLIKYVEVTAGDAKSCLKGSRAAYSGSTGRSDTRSRPRSFQAARPTGMPARWRRLRMSWPPNRFTSGGLRPSTEIVTTSGTRSVTTGRRSG